MPVWVSELDSLAEEAEVYDDLLTGITDEDEVVAEACEGAASGKYVHHEPEHFDFDCLNNFTEELGGPAYESVLEKEVQLACSTPYLAEYVEILFDVTMLYVSDEDLALRAVFAPEALPMPQPRSVAQAEASPTPELLDTSELKQQPTVAVHNIRNVVSGMLDFNLSPVIDHFEETISAYSPRQGRSLMRPAPMFEKPTTDVPDVAKAQSVEEPSYGKLKPVTADDKPDNGPASWQVEYDQVLRYVTGRSFLPGLEHLCNTKARSAFIQYNNDVNALSRATSSFLGDRQDGECGCLDGKAEALQVPGENFFFTDSDELIGLSAERPSAQSIFDLMDEFVDDEMMDEAGTTDASPDIFDDIDELVDADMFDDDYTPELLSDASEFEGGMAVKELPPPGVFFDITSRKMITFVALGQLLYPPTSSIVSHANTDDNVSDISDNEYNDPDMTQAAELTYFAADVQQSVAYTAFNQLLQATMGQQRSAIQPDLDDAEFEDIGLSELIELYPEINVPSSPQPDGFGFHFNRLRMLPMVQLVSNQPTQRQLVARQSYRRLFGRRNPRKSLRRLVITSNLLPIPEDGRYAYPNSSSSPDSLNFENRRAFVCLSSAYRPKFLDDEGEIDNQKLPVYAAFASDYPPCAQPNIADTFDMFTDHIWHTAPSLAVTDTLVASGATLAPIARFPDNETLEVYEIEIHSLLTSMFNSMNSGRYHDLPTLSNNLHWVFECAHRVPWRDCVGELGSSHRNPC